MDCRSFDFHDCQGKMKKIYGGRLQALLRLLLSLQTLAWPVLTSGLAGNVGEDLSLIAVQSASDKVNLLIGTGGEGFGVGSDPPGAQVPFGALRLSPDTSLDNVVISPNHFGGYHHSDNEIRCFSHTHMVGPGVLDFGNIGVMATRKIDNATIRNYGYRSKFSHSAEKARPGHYQVTLETPGIDAQLTACGSHAGIHQYQVQSASGQPTVILFDPTHSLTKDACNGSFVHFNTSTLMLTGGMVNRGSLTGRNGKGVNIYFASKLSVNILDYGTWNSSAVFHGTAFSQAIGASANGAFLVTNQSTVEVSIGISFISVEQAVANMEAQVGQQTFADCQKYAEVEWESVLSKVNVTGRDEDTEVKLYTALYHSMMAPTNYTEVGGLYLGMDDHTHLTQHSSQAAFSDMSIWDIHRTQVSLLAWLRPDVMADVVTSLTNMMEQGGDLPRWPIANVYAGCMIGNHAYQILLDALVKNITNFNVSAVYQTMKQEATSARAHNGRDDLYHYSTLGYCIGGYKNSSVSKTLAYAFDDWAVSEFARYLGESVDAEKFLNRSKNYRNLWDSSRKLMCARSASGEFKCPLDPELNDWILHSGDFTEGNAEQWKWFVPHDVPGLVQLFGSEEAFAKKLDEFMEMSHLHPLNLLPNPYYWAGNEPDILAPHLFNFANRSDLTQKHVRWLVDNKYTTQPDGLPGNDDYGTLSAWYVWSALGIYPLTGTPWYIVGSPSVSSATISVQDIHQELRTVEIIAHNNSATNVYVEKATINGKGIDAHSAFIHHEDLTQETGARLEFWMSDQPSQL